MSNVVRKIIISADLFDALINLVNQGAYKNHTHGEISNFISQIKLSIEELNKE